MADYNSRTTIEFYHWLSERAQVGSIEEDSTRSKQNYSPRLTPLKELARKMAETHDIRFDPKHIDLIEK